MVVCTQMVVYAFVFYLEAKEITQKHENTQDVTQYGGGPLFVHNDFNVNSKTRDGASSYKFMQNIL